MNSFLRIILGFGFCFGFTNCIVAQTIEINKACFNTESNDYGVRRFGEHLMVVSNAKPNADGSILIDEVSLVPYSDVFLVKDCDLEELLIMSEVFNEMISFNSSLNDAPISSNRAANLLFFSNNSFSPTNNLGIFYSTKTDGKWINPVASPMNNSEYNVTHPFYDEANKLVYFASDSKMGKGNYDIHYVAFNNGIWGDVKALDEVNTSSVECFPFVYGNRIYFTSDNPSSLGGLDLFYLENGTIIQMPEPINSIHDDLSIFFETDSSGYFSSRRESDGSYDDAYSFRFIPKPVEIIIEEVIEPVKSSLILVSGRVLNAKTKQPLKAEIIYEDPITGEIVGTTTSDSTTGQYKIELSPGSFYGFLAEKKEYYPVSDILDLTQLNSSDVLTRDLLLIPLEKGASIRLNNIFFDTDKSVLRPESTAELQRLIRFLHANSDIHIQLEGHTDSQGNAEYNLRLSNDRAKAVMTYLAENGIELSRLKSKGFGKNNPVATNDTPEGRQQNRRVEFRIGL